MTSIHPRKDDHGNDVVIHGPADPTGSPTWSDATAIAIFTPNCPVPSELNGVPFRVDETSRTQGDWQSLVEPHGARARLAKVNGKKLSAGAVIVEPDGRCWLFEPTNHFGGYKLTFPKGTVEAGWSLEASAAREVFEETGLVVRVGEPLIDVERSTSVARYFRATRVDGSPAAMGWESQSVRLVPTGMLFAEVTAPQDAAIVKMLSDGLPT